LKPKSVKKLKLEKRKNEIIANLEAGENVREVYLNTDLDYNLDLFKSYLHNCSDVIYREIELELSQPVRACIIYVDGLVNNDTIDRYILLPLLELRFKADQVGESIDLITELKDKILAVNEIIQTGTLGELLDSLLTGSTIVLVDGFSLALACTTKGWEDRPVTENTTETVVRGPREAFVENIRTNTALLRRRLKTHRLKIETMLIGRESKTETAIVYMEGIASEEMVEEVRKRLKRIEIDSTFGGGEIEEFISDNPYSIFPQVRASERPDSVASDLLSGRVAIITDGTPIVLVVPVIFLQFIQSSEDYYQGIYYGSLLRLLRLAAFFLTLTLPSLYVAITTFHHGMLPSPLYLSVAAGREGVPFPALLEALLMEFTFEILKEAGVRLPKAVGQTVSIVGALVVGESAVRAGLVSPLMVIVVSLTAIFSFVIPNYSVAITIRFLRFPLMILAGTLGFFGLTWGLLLLLFRMVSLRSFGVPYFSPLAPLNLESWKDIFVRAPWFRMRKRPYLFVRDNVNRMPKMETPQPPKKSGEEK
jgi:spore germination protein KA